MPNRISILIVDDEESVRDSLYNWFIDDGYRVESAENAKKALACSMKKNLILSWLILRCRGWMAWRCTAGSVRFPTFPL